MLEGKTTGRPGFAHVVGGDFRCHRVEQLDLGFAYERVHYQTPAFNFFQFGAELFPEWTASLEGTTPFKKMLHDLQRLPLRELLGEVLGARVEDAAPEWITRVHLVPYHVVAKDTGENWFAQVRVLYAATSALTEVIEQGHKHAHYNAAPLLLKGDMLAESLERLCIGAERGMRKLDKLQEKERIAGTCRADSKLRRDYVRGPLRIEYERQKVTTKDAGAIVELPWALDDADWAEVTTVDKDRVGASGATEEGHHLQAICRIGPYEHHREQQAYCYLAQVQHVLNCAIYGFDVKNMVDLDWITDDLRRDQFHTYLGFGISDIFQKAVHAEKESDAKTSTGRPYANPFGGIHAAELAQADMERDCAEACFHARWLKKHRREQLTAWKLRTGM
jgi:hypothetical protein